MFTFSQVDDHITTLIKHLHHPNVDKAKELLDKIERRGRDGLIVYSQE
jgi:hypothetical protein